MTAPILKTTEQKIDEIYRKLVTDIDSLDTLNVISAAVGFYNTYLNMKQISNDQIMNELRKQDDEYFTKLFNSIDDIKNELECIKIKLEITKQTSGGSKK